MLGMDLGCPCPIDKNANVRSSNARPIRGHDEGLSIVDTFCICLHD